ncbi:MAG: hypothetical protein KC464_04700, partial [Myxococcales bacterium]|nr:hypothetical protein [Myxococcales bacterium]
MRYLDLIAARPVLWTLFLTYLAAVAGLAVLGRRRARADARSFAIGRTGPVVAGMTLAASIASTATFVINPGFVYVHGVSALLHFGVAAVVGMTVGLLLVCGKFRRQGAAAGAVTLPQWVGQRYGSRGLRLLFAAMNLLSLCFVVLIVGGLSIVMQKTLGLGNVESLVIVTVFVFGYVLIGGAYANAYANTFQAAIMGVVAIMIVGSGLHHLAGGLGAAADKLRAIDPNLVAPVNAASPLFGSVFSVFVSGFVIGFALMCQPHIMTTALYVEDDRKMRRALAVAITLSIVFASVLLAGLWARLADIPASAFVDPATGAFRQDRVMTVYLAETFSPAAMGLVMVALLAAGMSTMSALLVALSSITGNDLYLGLRGLRRGAADADAGDTAARAQRASRVVLIGLGLLVFLIALHPPRLLGIFGQLGVYGLVAAAAAPIVLGVLLPAMGRRSAFAAALVGGGTHFGLYFLGGIANPAASATYGILASVAVALAGVLLGARGR